MSFKHLYSSLAIVSLSLLACQEPVNQELVDALQGSSARLATAIEQREIAKTDLGEFHALDAVTELFDRLSRKEAADQMVHPRPPGPASGQGAGVNEKAPKQVEPTEKKAKPNRELRPHAEMLADLLHVREELALRGAVDSHRASAEAAWELDTLRLLAAKLILPEDFPPKNEFRLLKPSTIDKLIERWTEKQHYLERFAAAAPFADSKPALEECAAKLQALREARSAPQAQASLLPRPRDALGDIKVWLSERAAERTEAIKKTEQQSLERALAKVPEDVAVAMRLAVLKAEGGSLPPESARLAFRKQARDLAYALSPRPAPKASQAEDLLRALISDPLTAAQNEAALDLAWSELRATESPSQLDVLLPKRLRNDREAWIASLLSDKELLHANAFLAEALSRLKIVNTQWPTFLRSTSLPEERIERFAESVKGELAFRKSGQAQAAAAASAASELPAALMRLATNRVPEILTSPEGRRREWEALQRYAAAGVSGSEIERRLSGLTLAGLQDQVDHFEVEAKRYRSFRSGVTEKGLPLLPAVAVSNLANARRDLWGKGWRIRRGLDQLNGSSVQEVAKLKRRMDDAILLCGLRWGPDDKPPEGGGGKPPKSPPGSHGPAAPYTDPAQLAATRSFESHMANLESLAPIPERAGKNLPTFALEKDHDLRVRLASNGTRPEAEGWRVDGVPVAYSIIDNLESVRALPGGVTLGRPPEVVGDFRKYGLIYDAEDRRLKLLSLDETIVLPEVAPAILKACFLFARDPDPVAVSIGYTGDNDKLLGVRARRVAIHPALRDTQVGLEVIEADRLPWSLEDEALPNGKKNLFASQMRPLIEQVRKETRAALPVRRFLAEVEKKGYSLDPAQSASWETAILELSGTSSGLDLMIRAVASAEQPGDRFDKYSALEDEEILAQIDKLLGSDEDITELYKKYLEEQRKPKNLAEQYNKYLEKRRETKDPIRYWRERQVQGQPGGIFESQERDDPYDALLGREGVGIAEEYRAEKARKRRELLMKERSSPEAIERRQQIREALERLPSDKDSAIFALSLSSFSLQESPPWNDAIRMAIALARSVGSKAVPAEEIAEQTLLLVQAKQLSLLTDARIRWARAGNSLREESALKVRYVRGKVQADDKGLSRPDVAAEHPAAGKAATDLLPRLEPIYPALARTREAAAWIALLRWALEPGHVAWLDLADLAATDHRTVVTPDYFCNAEEGRRCLEEIGKTAP